MPSGREYHTPKPYVSPTLDPGTLSRMRAPPDPNQNQGAFTGNEADSDDEVASSATPVGAFPGTAQEYGAERQYY